MLRLGVNVLLQSAAASEDQFITHKQTSTGDTQKTERGRCLHMVEGKRVAAGE